MVKLWRKHWLRFAIAFIFWLFLVLAWHGFDRLFHLSAIASRFSTEFFVTTAGTIVTAIATAVVSGQKERSDRNSKEVERLKEIISSNNQAMLETSKRLEDNDDGVMLELRRMDALNLSIAELRGYIDRNTRVIEELAREQERQRERLAQGDRLLHFANLIESVVRDNEQIKCELKGAIANLNSSRSG